MKKWIISILLVLSIGTVSAGTYTLVSANYPILVNGEKVNVQPYNLNGTTLLPIRQVSDATGLDINWNGKAVEIETLDVEKLKESCVMIYAESSSLGSQGSAVCWDYGEYLTAYHIVDNGQTNIKTSSGDELTVDSTNETLDIATLDTTDDVKPVKIGDSDEVKVGDKVIIIGSPDRKENTVIYATVKELTNEIVVSASLNGGGSGSAVFDMNGSLIGIVVARNEKLNETYITPINDIRKAF